MSVHFGGTNISMDCLVAICGNLDRRTKARFQKPFDFSKKIVEKCADVLHDFECALNKYETHNFCTKYLESIEILKQTEHKKIDENILRAYSAKLQKTIRTESLNEINVESLEIVAPTFMILEYPNAEVLPLELVNYARTITKVTLINCQLQDEWLKPLTYLSHVTHLNVTFNPELTGKYIAEIGRLSHLNISDCVNIKAFFMKEIAEAHQLEELIVHGCPVLKRAHDTHEISQIWMQLQHLKKLSMRYPINKCGYEALGGKLVNLKIIDCIISTSPVTLLTTLRTNDVIEELTLSGTNLETVDVALLVGTPLLKKVCIKKCKLDFNATKLMAFAEPLSLEDIKFCDCVNYQNVLSAVVQQCVQLKNIDIDEEYDDELNAIAQEVLNIAHMLRIPKVLVSRRSICINTKFNPFEHLNDMEIELLLEAENLKNLILKIDNEPAKPYLIIRKNHPMKPLIELKRAIEEAKASKVIDEYVIDSYQKCTDKTFANKNLQSLRPQSLDVYKFDIVELNFLRYMPTINTVVVKDCNLKDKDMESLVWLHNLKDLDISYNTLLTGRYLNECGSLNTLNITECKRIRAFWLYEIAKNNRLVELIASDCPVFSGAFDTHYLNLIWLHFADISVLRMSCPMNMCGIKYLSYSLPNLKELSCNLTGSPNALLSTLNLNTSIEKLVIKAVDRMEIVDLAFLNKMSRLRELCLDYFKLEFNAKKKTGAKSLLNRIQLSRCRYFKSGILSAMLKKFQKLRRIDIQNEDIIEYEAILNDIWQIAKTRTEKSKELLITCDKNLFKYLPEIDEDKVEHIKKVINLEFDDYEDFSTEESSETEESDSDKMEIDYFA